MQHPNQLKTELLKYLQFYLSKKLLMNDVLLGIKQRLIMDNKISTPQFHSLLSFLEREKKFKGMNRKQIFDHFLPLITTDNSKEPINATTNLTQFFS